MFETTSSSANFTRPRRLKFLVPKTARNIPPHNLATTTTTTALASTTGTTALEGTARTMITFASTTETMISTSKMLSAANALGHGSGAVDPGYVAAARQTDCRVNADVGATQGNGNQVASDSSFLPCSSTTGTTRTKRQQGRRGNCKSSAHRKVPNKEEKRKEVRVMVAKQSSNA